MAAKKNQNDRRKAMRKNATAWREALLRNSTAPVEREQRDEIIYHLYAQIATLKVGQLGDTGLVTMVKFLYMCDHIAARLAQSDTTGQIDKVANEILRPARDALENIGERAQGLEKFLATGDELAALQRLAGHADQLLELTTVGIMLQAEEWAHGLLMKTYLEAKKNGTV